MSMRLRHVATVNPPVQGLSRADAGTEISFIPLEAVWSDERFDPTQVIEFSGDVRSYNPVAEGDLLVPKVSPTFAHGRTCLATGLEGRRALATSEVFVVRPQEPETATFLKYRLLASDFLSEGQASWTGVAGLKRVSAEFVRNVRVDPETLTNSGTVAGFLDRECDRIHELLSEIRGNKATADHSITTVFRRLLPEPAPVVPLRRLIRTISDGPFGSSLASEHYVDRAEVRVIRLGNVGSGEFVDRDRAFVSFAYARGPMAQHAVQAGDVIVAGLGDANHPLGRACVVPPALQGSIHKADCYRIQVDPSKCLPAYLAAALSFGPARDIAPLMARGSTRARLNTVVARELPIPDIPLVEQEQAIRVFGVARNRVNALAAEYDQLAEALRTYRESLITEAVTGTLDVTKLSDSQMAESLTAVREGERPEVLSS